MRCLYIFLLTFSIPVTSAANSFNGLGIIVAAIYTAIPAVIILIILIITSVIFFNSESISVWLKEKYRTIALFISIFAPLIFPALSIYFENKSGSKAFTLIFWISLPLLILGIISFFLAKRI